MRVGEVFDKPESSFLIVEKDVKLIAEKMLSNQRLLKYLHYRDPNPLQQPSLTAREKLELINHEIRIVPKYDIEKKCPNIVVITFNNFTPNANNPKFRNCILCFDILCHPDHWNLGDFQLRPYKIAGEIDAMFNNAKMVGIGTLEFMGANELTMNEQLMGLTMFYRSVQSTEDTIPVE